MSINHYSMMRRGAMKMARCSAVVFPSEANASLPVTCPDCLSRLAGKVCAEIVSGAVASVEQEKRLHEATANHFHRVCNGEVI